MSDEKTALRAAMRKIAETRGDTAGLSMHLAARLREWEAWQSSASVAGFSSLPGEPDLLDPWPQDKRIALPRVVGEELAFHWVSGPAELTPGRFGVLEPAAGAAVAVAAFDLILVPGLAFDSRGRRLGRGKGCYDRFLSSAQGLRAGVCFDDQIVSGVPAEPHDARVDFLVTPSAFYRCGA